MAGVLRIIGLVVFVLCASRAMAQLDNRAFFDTWRVHPEDSGSLRAECNVLSYMRNNEYFNPVADGYTLFGYQLHPRVAYYINSNVRLQIGAFLQREFGDNKYQFAEPTYSLTYQKDSLQFILGNIQSSLTHGFIEPMYDFEKVISQRLEQGAQLRYKTQKFSIDAYIDWQKHQYDYAPFKEQLLHGNVMRYKLVQKSHYQLDIPLQYTVFHRGGQIDTLRSVGALVKWNAALGLRNTWWNDDLSFWQLITLEAEILGASNTAPTLQGDYGNGLGYYVTSSIKTKPFTLMLNYWRGEHWSSPLAGALYQSVPSAIFTEKSLRFPARNLLFIRLLRDFSLGSGVTLTTRIEPYCDLVTGKWEYNYGLYVNTTPAACFRKPRIGRSGRRRKDWN